MAICQNEKTADSQPFSGRLGDTLSLQCGRRKEKQLQASSRRSNHASLYSGIQEFSAKVPQEVLCDSSCEIPVEYPVADMGKSRSGRNRLFRA